MEIPVYNKGGAPIAKAFVDAEDYKQVSLYKWYLKDDGYAYAHVNGKIISMQDYVVKVLLTFSNNI